MGKLVFVIAVWVVSIVAYIWLIKWIQGRFNFSVSGSQNWGSVHLLIMAFVAPFAAAFLGVIYGITYVYDKKKAESTQDDFDI